MKIITIIALILGVGGSLLYFIFFKNRIKYLCAYAQNPSDMFRRLSEGTDDNAQFPIFPQLEPLLIVFHGARTGG